MMGNTRHMAMEEQAWDIARVIEEQAKHQLGMADFRQKSSLSDRGWMDSITNEIKHRNAHG